MPVAYHLVARARPGQLLFTDAEEGARLWRMVLSAAPGLEALALMPNHLHLLHPRDVRRPLADALGRYVRWRNHRLGARGSTLEPLPDAQPIADVGKLRRHVRYVHLNPCRARLVRDPLAWPWSTHRDRLGLSLEPAVPRAPQPRRFHRYVSADPTVRPEGTDLPAFQDTAHRPERVRAVVASLARVPETALCRRGRWRSVYLAAAATLCDAPASVARAAVGVGRGAVTPSLPQSTSLVARVLHDPRFEDVEAGERWRWSPRPR